MLPRLNVDDINYLRTALLSDFFLFHRVMFEKRTGREFLVSQPEGNESHFHTLARTFNEIFLLKHPRTVINIPPGWGKSELCKSFIAWCLAHYPDSKFLYVSHSFELAALHTGSIKQTISMPIYKQLFGVEVRRDSSARDFFMTTAGGAVAAFGAQGGITGHDAGLPGLDRISGMLVIDDIHKPDEVHSDVIRGKIKTNFSQTLERRLRAPNVPITFIGQRLHEDDLPGCLINGEIDGRDWNKVIIKGLDDAGNARYPEVNPKNELLRLKETQPYVFWSQIQQMPQPAGGSLFKEAWFPLLHEMPKILATFVTADTAQTPEEYNDPSVFSFWGIYNLEFNGVPIVGMYALHWIDCVEIWLEPKDLEANFLDFWASCMRFPVQPRFAAIENKSTGVTLISVLKNTPGLRILPIERAGTKSNKSYRFITMQPYASSGQISLPAEGKHTEKCLTHMGKITANQTHRYDDICDTAYDAVKLVLIDKVSIIDKFGLQDYSATVKTLMGSQQRINELRRSAHAR